MRAVLSLLLVLNLYYPTLLRAQGIVFEKSSWPEAVLKAKKQKKLLFLQLDKPDCGSCSEVANVAFNSALVREKFAVHFISVRLDGTTGIGKELAQKLNVECVPSAVYLDSQESPLARLCGTTSLDRAYLEKAEEAITRHQLTPLKSMEETYTKGERSSQFIRAYIERRQQVGLPVDDVLDEFVRHSPPDSLRSANVLLFIFEQGPIVGTKADSVFRSNYARTDSLYRAVGRAKAIDLNNRIVNNSLRRAINEKNALLANRTASFRQRTYTNDHKTGMAAREWVMMRYYRGAGDTLRYLQTASTYYDKQFMTARVDSIQKLDELDTQRRMRGEISGMPTSTKSSGQFTFTPYPNTQRYVSALNQAAWEFQGLTRDSTYLQKALSWSKRSLDYREDGSLLDTYAHILYRLGRKQEAVEWQQKAVQKERSHNSPLVNSLEATLKKMQLGTL